MIVTAPRTGYIVIPHGRSLVDFLNEPVEIIWNQERLDNIIQTMTFHGEKENPPVVVPLSVGFPIEVDDGLFNQNQAAAPVRRQAFRAMPMPINNIVPAVAVEAAGLIEGGVGEPVNQF